jgi:hypothetical protein
VGLEMGHSFSLRLHITAFKAEMYTIEACIMGNIGKVCTGKNTYVLSNIQAAIKGP